MVLTLDSNKHMIDSKQTLIPLVIATWANFTVAPVWQSFVGM